MGVGQTILNGISPLENCNALNDVPVADCHSPDLMSFSCLFASDI